MTDIYDQLKKLSPEKRELLELMLKEKGVDVIGSKIIPQERDSHQFPLSFGQQRMWFLDQLEPGTPLYNNPAAVLLKGDLDILAMEKALNEIVNRHEVLRTTFATENDQPIQIINGEMPTRLEQIDLRHLADSEREQEAMQIAKAEAQKPFDLTTGPLFRVTLLQLADREYLMILVMHHIVSDGWSLNIFIQEVAILYKVLVAGHQSPLPDLQVQYADFAVWQRQWLKGDVLEKQLSYWREQLEDAPPLLNLPLDHPRPAFQGTVGTTYFFDFADHLYEKISGMAKQEDVTLFMILLAAFNALLYRYTNQDDICIGTPIAGRNRKETESLIGFFVNTLVMRADLAGNPTVGELLKRIKAAALGAYGHQDIPFETLVEKLQPERDMSVSPFFQVMFVHLDTTAQSITLPDITIEPRQIDSGTAKFDLSFVVAEGENRLSGQIVYNSELFKPGTIERLAEHFQILLESFVKDATVPIAELAILSEAEQKLLSQNWNRSPVEFHQPQQMCLQQLIEIQVDKTPEETAVIYEDERLSYQQLNQRANQLAHYLLDRGVAPEMSVGIYLEDPINMIVSLLAIFKAGGAFLPLDPNYPMERLSFMMDDSKVPVIITEQNLLALLPENESQKICLIRDQEVISQQSQKNPKCRITAENLAYIIYTSGSTGKPKGVLVSHGAIADHCLNMRDLYELKSSDYVLQFASMNFDASLEQILPTLISGAKLVLRGNEIWSPEQFQQNIARYGLTVVNPPTAYWKQLLNEWDESIDSNQNGKLRLFIVGGDLMSSESLPQWNNTSLTSAKLLNAYGPTEALITSTTFEIPANYNDSNSTQGLPIGRPTPLRYVYLLDQYFQQVPIGISGELCIGGDCLARGYLRRPDLTAEKFIPDPFGQKTGGRLYRTGDLARFLPDGNIEFLGRIDNQVKVRGFRIELGEIESVINQYTGVTEGVVVARADESVDKQLVAYIAVEADFSTTELRNFLREKLPDYMVPSVFVTLDQLPRTPIGKVDRKKLPEPDQSRPDLATEFVAPRTPTEVKLAEIVSEILKVERVGMYDNFFDLGGHSMLATQMVSRIRRIFDVEISLRSLFENPTIDGIANSIAEAQVHAQDEEELESMLSELEGLSDEEAQTIFGDVKHEQKQFYAAKEQSSNSCNQPHVAPRNELEKYLVDVWKEILDVDEVGVYDHFFEIGGDADKATKLLKRLEDDFNDTAPPWAIFQAPRLVNFAMSMLEYYPELIEKKLGKITNYPKEYYKGIKPRDDLGKIDLKKVQQCRNLIQPLAARENEDDESRSKNRRAIFVLSPPRSGSTLLRVMLAGNKNLFSPPELDLLAFNTIQERQTFFEKSGLTLWLEALTRVIMEIKNCDAGKADQIFDDLLKKNFSIKEFYRVLQDWIGDRLLVDKTPSYPLDIKILQRAETDFDEPYYIHLLRHPYAMIYSFVEAKLDQHFFKYKHHFARRELAELIWIISHQNILEFFAEIPDSRKFQLKFEDLVVEPRPVLERLCDFLKIDFQEQMLEPYEGNKMTDGIKPGSQMVGDFKFYLRKKIDPKTTNRWKKYHKQDFLSDISKELAAKFGYEI